MGLVPPRLIRPRAKPDVDWYKVKQLSDEGYTVGQIGAVMPEYREWIRLSCIVRKGYQPSHPEPEQNPPQSVSGAIPYQTSQDHEQIIQRLCDATNTWHSAKALRFVDWDMFDVWRKYADALREAAMNKQDQPPPIRDARALEWGLRAGIITPDEARIHYRYSAPPQGGAATIPVVTSAFGGGQSNRALLHLMQTIEQEISPESIDGIEPCGYDAL